MTINVAIYLDEQYAQHAAVMVRSLIENMRPEHSLRLFVLFSNLNPGTKHKMQANWQKGNLIVDWVDLNNYATERNVSSVCHISGAAYLRLYIGLCLPDTINRVITLDCDGIVLGDIFELWQHAPKEHCLMAVQDPCVPRLEDDHSSFMNSIKVDKSALYFNSGMMVVDLKKWREKKISERCLDMCEQFVGKSLYADQSFLNAVLQGAWEKLPLNWNCSKRHLLMHYYPSMRNRFYSKAEVTEALINPKFSHFLSSVKPWDFAHFHLEQTMYFRYLNKTNWDEDCSVTPPNLGLRSKVYFHLLYFRQTQNLRRKFGLPAKWVSDYIHFLKSLMSPRLSSSKLVLMVMK